MELFQEKINLYFALIHEREKLKCEEDRQIITEDISFLESDILHIYETKLFPQTGPLTNF